MKINILKAVSILSFGLLILIAQSCVHKQVEMDKTEEQSLSREENDILDIEKYFYLNESSSMKSLIEKFETNYPNSTYKSYLILLQSRSLSKNNQFAEALLLNQKVQAESFNSNKKIYFQALFYSSDIYEAQGKYDNLLATLVECEKNKEFLVEKVKFFELPLKLSISYARLNQSELSLKYFNEAELGLKEYLAKGVHTKKSISQLYYEIGSGTNQIVSNDFFIEFRKISITYKYLIYSLNLQEEVFSEKAKQQLIEQLKTTWNLISMDTGVDEARNEKENKKFLKLTEFSKMLNTIQLMEPLEDRQKTLLQKDFFSFVDDLQNKTYDQIYSNYNYTPPTDESFRHNIFREKLKLEEIKSKEM